jgi:CheY-like chemotaxis protein/predicted regulator of Ras-like GTPase activity (Roadblock/LC7/MglB family)
VAAPRSGKRIVLVDDEEALAWSLMSRLQKVRPNDRVETANDGETALKIMQTEKADLLIADIRMPGMSGIDLVLSARRVQTELPVIVMTAFKSADITRLNSGPFTGFLEKPFEFDALLALVEQALEPRVVGFSGAISVQTLPDVVQLYVLSSATGLLSVRHGKDVGCIYFAQGAILDASTEAARGDDAFYEIMLWSGGEFSMQPGATAPARSVHSNWQELLMESVRRGDEARRQGEPMSAKTGWTQAPPPAIDADAFEDAFSDFSLDAASGINLAPAAIPTIPVSNPQTTETSMNIKDSLTKLNQIDGFVGAALVDSESGMLLGQEGGGNINLEIAAAGNTEVVRAKRKTMNNLSIKDQLEDMLITLSKQYHLIRPLRARSTLFFYVVLDRSRANLAMARIGLADVEKDLQI